MIGKLGIVMVVVKDVKRSVAFYRDILGLKVGFESPEWTQLSANNIDLGLHPESEHLKVQPGGCQIGFFVQDVQKAAADLKKKGVRFVMEPSKRDFGWLAVFSDPDGYHIQLAPATTYEHR